MGVRVTAEWNHLGGTCRSCSGCTLNTPINMGKVRILAEFWSFLRVRKKFWLAPIVLVLLLLSLLIVLTQGSALAPFIYALF